MTKNFVYLQLFTEITISGLKASMNFKSTRNYHEVKLTVQSLYLKSAMHVHLLEFGMTYSSHKIHCIRI